VRRPLPNLASWSAASKGELGKPAQFGPDAWTVGEQPCIMFDTGVAAYAKPAS
jgi:hypothetical protein